MNEWEEQTGVLEFRGSDAVRFLNGQVTQDVRKAAPDGIAIPSCVTDAKGRLQFRIWIAQRRESGSLLIFTTKHGLEALEARLTRYLIADDVEVRDVSGEVDPGSYEFPGLRYNELERIEQGIPKWGAEMVEGMLPPEAGLDATDISYHKGCYIGQEVISRIRSAGKVNRRLVKLKFDGEGKIGEFTHADGKICGEVTSVSGSIGLGYLKRSAEGESEFLIDGVRVGLRS